LSPGDLAGWEGVQMPAPLDARSAEILSILRSEKQREYFLAKMSQQNYN
jgi:hypothetical protein